MEHEALGGEGRPNVAKVAIITGEAQGLRVRFFGWPGNRQGGGPLHVSRISMKLQTLLWVPNFVLAPLFLVWPKVPVERSVHILPAHVGLLRLLWHEQSHSESPRLPSKRLATLLRSCRQKGEWCFSTSSLGCPKK